MTARSGRFRSGQGGWRTRAGHNHPLRSPDDLSDFPSSDLTGIGETLRQAREARGISYATAERETHIPRHHLQALEEERFEAFHAPVYVRGFLRSYSQYLGLDSNGLLALLPPDSPLEDERLPPLSRLGRPRGPNEAARARRDPAERDAPPLTELPQRPGSEELARDWEARESGRMRFAIDPGVGAATAGPSRLDPLGRLGWPEQLDDSRRFEDPDESEGYLLAPDRTARAPFTKRSWEEPLMPRRANRWHAPVRHAVELPQDVQPLFRPYPLLLCTGGFLIVLVALVVALTTFGGDGDPAVFATGIAPGAAPVAIHTPAGQPAPHGSMPDVQGVELKSALATLQSSGIVPIVVVQGSGDISSGRVSAQAPTSGSALGPETPALIVVDGSN